jgi:hypothetical protein
MVVIEFRGLPGACVVALSAVLAEIVGHVIRVSFLEGN